MKVWNYIYISLTMMLFFEFVGIPTALSGLFSFLNVGISNGILTGFNFSFSSFMSYLFSGVIDIFSSGTGWLTALTAGSITAGLFYAGKPDIAIKAGLAGGIFFAFINSLYFPISMALTEEISPWALGILAIIFIPFTVGFGFALFEYIIGGNTD